MRALRENLPLRNLWDGIEIFDRISGIVILELIIDRTGKVTDARVLKPLPFGLDDAAVEAVRQWQWKPGTLAGEPVDVIFNVTVNFKLEE